VVHNGQRVGSDFLQLDPGRAPARGRSQWLARQIRDGILDGRLVAGDPLPPTRALAADLGWSRGVIVEAYRRLRDEGLVSGRFRAGTTITTPVGRRYTVPVDPPDAVVTARAAEVLDLSPGVPDLTRFPVAAWLRAEREVLGGPRQQILRYGDPAGEAPLRNELARWLATNRGTRATPDDIIIVAGVAQALAITATVLVRRGHTAVGVEDPGSAGARDELAHWGLTPAAVPVDDGGLVSATLAGRGIRAVLTTPAHQYPTGVVLSPDRRRELLGWARATGGLVIEDDYDAEHRYDRAPVPALQASAPDHVLYTGSVSKTLAPAVRLGWLIAPAALREELVAAKFASDIACPTVTQLTVARLLAGGTYDAHLRRSRHHQRTRRDVILTHLRAAIPDADIRGIAAGLHLLVTFPGRSLDDRGLARLLSEDGVIAEPLSPHRISPGPPGLILGYAALAAGPLSRAVGLIRRRLDALSAAP
jgi:GntR family transcriptional regulator/MocR family aminotransferase